MTPARDYLNSLQFGRLEPDADKKAQNYVYSLSTLGLSTPTEVNISLPLLQDLFDVYDQGNTNGCTGYSSSWMSSINNYPEYGVVKYNAAWLYHEGQNIDGDPATTPQADNGGYLWAVMDVLRKSGHVLLGGDSSKPQSDHGIDSYYWCKSVDDIRTAFTLGRCPVLGINWYSKFMDVQEKDNEWWMGLGSSWGRIVGGHAIAIREALDKYDAFRLRNTWAIGYWGDIYGEALLPYKAMERLFIENGECAIAVDKKVIELASASSSVSSSASSSPSQEEKDYLDISLTDILGVTKVGRLVEV